MVRSEVRRAASFVLLLICALALAIPARAQSGVKVGSLTCNESGGVGLILGSAKRLNCSFAGPNGLEHYLGTISKIGVDIGFTAGGTLVWAVFAPTGVMVPGSLAGTYVGATASATVGIGVGANALIGGSGNTVALQPLSVEGNQGLNVAGGIGTITLAPAGPPLAPPPQYAPPPGGAAYAPPPAYAPRAGGFMQACYQERQQFCGGVAPGGGRIISCLRQHMPQLSPVCAQALPGGPGAMRQPQPAYSPAPGAPPPATPYGQ